MFSFKEGVTRRLASQSKDRRPRLGFYSPSPDDLAIGGSFVLTIRPFGDDLNPGINFTRSADFFVQIMTSFRSDLAAKPFFALPWYIVIVGFSGPIAELSLIFTNHGEYSEGTHN